MHDELVAELAEHYPDGASILDPFSGRAMIPLEAARLGVKAYGIDYSPVATLAGKLLADYPLRDWSSEPPLPFDGYSEHAMRYPEAASAPAVRCRVLGEVDRRPPRSGDGRVLSQGQWQAPVGLPVGGNDPLQ